MSHFLQNKFSKNNEIKYLLFVRINIKIKRVIDYKFIIKIKIYSKY